MLLLMFWHAKDAERSFQYAHFVVGEVHLTLVHTVCKKLTEQKWNLIMIVSCDPGAWCYFARISICIDICEP